MKLFIGAVFNLILFSSSPLFAGGASFEDCEGVPNSSSGGGLTTNWYVGNDELNCPDDENCVDSHNNYYKVGYKDKKCQIEKSNTDEFYKSAKEKAEAEAKERAEENAQIKAAMDEAAEKVRKEIEAKKKKKN